LLYRKNPDISLVLLALSRRECHRNGIDQRIQPAGQLRWLVGSPWLQYIKLQRKTQYPALSRQFLGQVAGYMHISYDIQANNLPEAGETSKEEELMGIMASTHN
jgi:hypothetical protein